MAKQFFVALLLMFVRIGSLNAQMHLDSLSTKLNHFDFGCYEGKPVDSLLQALPRNYVTLKLYGHLTSSSVYFLGIDYPGNILVSVYVHKYRFMNPVSDSRTWDLELYKKEEIACVELVNPY